jgi:hypothetical protein
MSNLSNAEAWEAVRQLWGSNPPPLLPSISSASNNRRTGSVISHASTLNVGPPPMVQYPRGSSVMSLSDLPIPNFSQPNPRRSSSNARPRQSESPVRPASSVRRRDDDLDSVAIVRQVLANAAAQAPPAPLRVDGRSRKRSNELTEEEQEQKLRDKRARNAMAVAKVAAKKKAQEVALKQRVLELEQQVYTLEQALSNCRCQRR